MRRRSALSLALLLAIAGSAAPAGALESNQRPVRVGVVIDGPWEGNDQVLELTRTEVDALTRDEFEVDFPASALVVGDWTYAGARAGLDRLLADPEVDVVITWGLLASHAACCYLDLPKPVIAPVVADVRVQGLPYADGVSGVHNLSYVVLPTTLAEELTELQQVVPFRRVAVLGSREFLEALPPVPFESLTAAADAGFAVEFVPVGDSVDEALAAIPEGVDAVYLWPQLQLPRGERRRLVEGLDARRLPSFASLGLDQMELGVLASVSSPEFFQRLARRVALNLQRILLGEEPGSIPVHFSYPQRLFVNMETARRIGVSPTLDSLVEAEVLHADPPDLPRRSLGQVVEEALAVNLEVEAGRRSLAAGEQLVAGSRSVLLPQVGLSAAGVAIDEDRAAASLGSQAERTWSGSLGLSQVLYSESALAGLEVQRQLQLGRVAEQRALELDTALEAAVVYLQLMRAKTLVGVQRNNLQVTRSHLELAETRHRVGAAGPAEVYRWQSQIAIDRKALIEAQAGQRVAEIALNRVLHRDLEERFTTREVGLDDPDLLTGQQRFASYTRTAARFRRFRDFLAQEAIRSSPDLARLDAAVQAALRSATAARRTYGAPSLALKASWEEVLEKSGTGSEGTPPLPGLALPRPDDRSWSVALSAALPLFSGGARRAEVVGAEEELAQRQIQLSAAAERLEERIRAQMELTRASFAGIELSARASAAAARNLELVEDAYSRGVVSIIELLDAQGAALNAEQVAAGAVYDFFIDLLTVERAANRFEPLLTPEEHAAWFEELDRFFADQGPAGPGEEP